MKIYNVNENPKTETTKGSATEKLEALLKYAEEKEAARYKGKPPPPEPPAPPPPPRRSTGEHLWWEDM
jgi:hypothetical protein